MWWRNSKVCSWLSGVLLTAVLLLSASAQEQPAVDATGVIKNLQFQAAEVRSVMSTLADYGNVNVVVAPDVTGTVTIRLQNVDWRSAMDIIASTYELAVVDGANGYIRVLKAETYRKEVSDQRKHDAEQRQLVGLETRIVKIANSVATDLVETVQSLMTERGKATADVRSNSVILQEVPENLQTVADYIMQLDKPAKQIRISAQLLEISSTTLEEMGVNWTASGTYTTASGRQFKQTGEVMADRTDDASNAGRYSINVLGNDWTLDGLIEAFVEEGKGKIVAHPEITTVENREARIQMGQKVPVKQFDASGNVVIKFEEVGTILVVTPHITAENQVLLHLKPERSTYEFDPNGVVINTNNAETNIIVNNGQTAVIGGLTTQDEVESEIGVPILKDIPLLGRLFKYTNKRAENRDLVIFVTPTIVESDLAMK
jgi:type IV pilus secretin PilQ/predicted competence protein